LKRFRFLEKYKFEKPSEHTTPDGNVYGKTTHDVGDMRSEQLG
jgi:hypothetical protein